MPAQGKRRCSVPHSSLQSSSSSSYASPNRVFAFRQLSRPPTGFSIADVPGHPTVTSIPVRSPFCVSCSGISVFVSPNSSSVSAFPPQMPSSQGPTSGGLFSGFPLSVSRPLSFLSEHTGRFPGRSPFPSFLKPSSRDRAAHCNTQYKTVDRKVRPVEASLPADAGERLRRAALEPPLRNPALVGHVWTPETFAQMVCLNIREGE